MNPIIALHQLSIPFEGAYLEIGVANAATIRRILESSTLSRIVLVDKKPHPECGEVPNAECIASAFEDFSTEEHFDRIVMWSTSWFVKMPYEEQITKLLSFANPGAYIVMNFLGERDSWVPDMQFEAISIEKLRKIVESSGASLVLTNESEFDGTDRTGALKQWHLIGAIIKKL